MADQWRGSTCGSHRFKQRMPVACLRRCRCPTIRYIQGITAPGGTAPIVVGVLALTATTVQTRRRAPTRARRDEHDAPVGAHTVRPM